MPAPEPVTKLMTPGGRPASRISEKYFQPVSGESLEGFRTTVFPATTAAEVIPARIASAKFQGGTTTPTPRGMYRSSLLSVGIIVMGCGAASRSISQA